MHRCGIRVSPRLARNVGYAALLVYCVWPKPALLGLGLLLVLRYLCYQAKVLQQDTTACAADADAKLSLLVTEQLDITRLHPATGALRRHQLATLPLLEEFDQICTEQGMPYWLDYGTLLGAVRHKGFIPWDDDLDVSMESADVEKLVDLLHQRYAGRLEVLWHRDGNQLKIRSLQDHRQFLDIWLVFPCRAVSEDEISRLEESFRRIKDDDWTVSRHSDFRTLNRQALAAVLTDDGKQSEYLFLTSLGAYIAAPHRPVVVRRSDIHPCQRREFEGHLYPVPANSDVVLRKTYGDYMRFPKRITERQHHRF